jgi:hypothetical protein
MQMVASGAVAVHGQAVLCFLRVYFSGLVTIVVL